MPYSPHTGRCRKCHGTFSVGVWPLPLSPGFVVDSWLLIVLLGAEYGGKLCICIFSIRNNKNNIAFQRLPEEKIQMQMVSTNMQTKVYLVDALSGLSSA